MTIIRLLATVAATALLCGPAFAEQAPTPSDGRAQEGKPAPDFSLRTIDGKTVTLADYRGKTLVLNVWATWCPPCRREMPTLIRVAQGDAKDSNTAFLGVDLTEEAPIVRAYSASKNVPYPLAIGTMNEFGDAYDIAGFPTTFVIDPQGVVRTRFSDELSPEQLAAFVSAGKAGRSVAIVSPLQSRIDAALANPEITFPAGDPAAIEAHAKLASTTIEQVESLADASDPASGNVVDYLKMKAEESVLRERAIAGLESAGAALGEKALLPKLVGDEASDAGRWTDAVTAYREALAVAPNQTDVLDALAYADERLGRASDAAAVRMERVGIESSVTALVGLALAQDAAGSPADASVTFAEAIDAAKRAATAPSHRPADVRMVAYASLYAGRNAAKNGDIDRADADFTQTLAWARMLPANDARHDMYLEEGQEAIAALALAPNGALSVSLAPWTGADLPGSIPNTIKYRLVVAGSAGKTVNVTTSGVPKTWVASFCTDRVCSPSRVAFALPPTGVKIVEFQLVPPDSKQSTPRVRVTGSDGTSRAAATN